MSDTLPKDDLVAQLRHDLRTPVNQILGYSEMLEEDAEAAGHQDYSSDLRKIQSAARNLISLINSRLNPDTVTPTSQRATSLQTVAHRPDAIPSPAPDDPAAVAVSLTGRVLVVDDDESNRDMLSRRLERHGLTVETAAHGREAIECVRRTAFDLVLLDIMMPVLDGYSALVEIKEDPAIRHIPVIMISALDELESVVRCIEAGAEDYLPKPFNPTLLRARLSACLEKKSMRDAEQQHLQTIERTQRRLTEELAEAEHYIQSILPPPVESPLRIDWKYHPSTELGGDAFGYHWIDDEHLAVYLLDVCGHGVGASLLSVTAINVIRSGSLPTTDFRDPGAVLAALNIAFPMERQNNMYFTLWYGVYHATTRTLRYASGGHPPALLIIPSPATQAEARQLRTPGIIIGAMEGIPFTSAATQVPEGASLFIFSDGCYEIRDPNDVVMEFAEFESYLKANSNQPDAPDQLLQWVQQRHGGGHLEDDFSLLRIRF